MSCKRRLSLATAITKRVGWEIVHCTGMPAEYAEGRGRRQVSRLRHQHGLADDGSFLDQPEGLHPVCKVEGTGDGGLELVLGEPAHQLLLRLGDQRAAPGHCCGLLGRWRRLAAPAGVVAVIE